MSCFKFLVPGYYMVADLFKLQDYCLAGCVTMYFGRWVPVFWRNLLIHVQALPYIGRSLP